MRVAVHGHAATSSFGFLREVLMVETGDLVMCRKPERSSAPDAACIGEGHELVTVQRRLPGCGLESVSRSVPFAFAFRASDPDAPIRHVE